MSAEHRRQLLAFSIVALAAFLLIGNALHNQFSTRDGQARTPAAVAAIAAGPTISSGKSNVEPGGAARGTTVIEPAAPPAASGTTSVTSSPLRAAPGHSDRARKADRAAQRSQSSAQEQGTRRSASTGSDDTVTSNARAAGDGKTAHAKKHGTKHGKKHGKKQRKHHRHAR
jgi:hypothetical protein